MRTATRCALVVLLVLAGWGSAFAQPRTYAFVHYGSHYDPVAGWDGQPGVRVVDIYSGTVVTDLPYPDGVAGSWQPFTSLDGRYVYLLSDAKVLRIDANTLSLEAFPVTGLPTLLRGVALPDGHTLLVLGGNTLAYIDATTFAVQRTVLLPVSANLQGYRSQKGGTVNFSPDRRTVYVVNAFDSSTFTLTAIDTDSGEEVGSVRLSAGPSSGWFTQFALSPDGDYAIVASLWNPTARVSLPSMQVSTLTSVSSVLMDVDFLSNDRIFLTEDDGGSPPSCAVVNVTTDTIEQIIGCYSGSSSVVAAVSPGLDRLIYFNGIGPSTYGHPLFVIGTTTPFQAVTAMGGFDANTHGWAIVSATTDDATPPVVTGVPAQVAVEATGTAGAAVVYSLPAAIDGLDGVLPVECFPGPGSMFGMGTTTVSCSAADAAGNATVKTFTVTVVDTTPPVMSGVPAVVTAETASTEAVVTWQEPLAADAVDGAVPVRCTPASGSNFPVGETTVTCTASDIRGNATHASFAVKVRSFFRASAIGIGPSAKVFVADVNNDGFNDILADQVYINDGTGGVAPIGPFNTSPYAGTDVKDFDNDGDLDYVLCGGGQCQFYVNDGTGRFTQGAVYGVGPGYNYDCRAGDFNNDGLVDVITNSHGYSWGAKTLWNQGNWVFTVQERAPWGAGISVDTGDFDRDGDIDWLWSNNMSTNTIYVNDGRGQHGGAVWFFWTHSSGSPISTFADLDADGLLDALVLGQ